MTHLCVLIYISLSLIGSLELRRPELRCCAEKLLADNSILQTLNLCSKALRLLKATCVLLVVEVEPPKSAHERNA